MPANDQEASSALRLGREEEDELLQMWTINGVPLRRRLQTLTVTVFVMGVQLMAVCTGTLAWMVYNPRTRYIALGYLTYMYLLDTSPTTGSKKSAAVRRSSWWRWFTEFFPVRLIRTERLDPQSKYIFGYHPHGIIGVGAICSFATEAPGFGALFPGLDPFLVTLPVNFRVPVMRELWLSMGLCDSSKQTFRNVLARGAGKTVVTVIGGAAEALQATPGRLELQLTQRKGFVRQALMHGANLVPVIGFGENDIWDVLQSGTLIAAQTRLQKLMGFAMPVFFGRGIFSYGFGFLPHRKPINVVVGRALALPAIDKASWEGYKSLEEWLCASQQGRTIVDECHAKYILGLRGLYDEYKDLYHAERVAELDIS